MKLTQAVKLAVCLIAVSGCRPDITTIEPGTTRIRFLNTVIGEDTTVTPAIVDVHVNGSTTPTGIAGLAPLSTTDWQEISEGIHTFVATLPGQSPADGGLFRFIARQYMTPGVVHTVIVNGVLNANGTPRSVYPLIVTNDPFAPPKSASGTYMARVGLVNAAPYAVGSAGNGVQLRMWVTPGTEPLTAAPEGVPHNVQLAFNARSPGYTDVEPGDVVITVTPFNNMSRVLASIPVRLEPGDVRSVVVFSKEILTGSQVPSVDNHGAIILVDGDY